MTKKKAHIQDSDIDSVDLDYEEYLATVEKPIKIRAKQKTWRGKKVMSAEEKRLAKRRNKKKWMSKKKNKYARAEAARSAARGKLFLQMDASDEIKETCDMVAAIEEHCREAEQKLAKA